MKRNYTVELLKLYFAISVAVAHAAIPISGPSPFLGSGMAVTLFFLLSGYFLVNSFSSGKYRSAWHYSYARFSRIYPYYLFAFIVLFLYSTLPAADSLRQIVVAFLASVPELVLLQNVGIFPGGINYPMWQLCCLIVVSHIMFALLEWNKNTTLNVICPLIAIFVYTYLENPYNGAEVDIWGIAGGFLYMPLVRAAGYISLGMFANYPVKKLLQYLEESTLSCMPVLVSLASIPLLILCWLFRENDALPILFFLLLVCLFYSKSIYPRMFRSKVFGRLDKLSLAIYVNHAVVILFYNNHAAVFNQIPCLPQVSIFIVFLILYCVVMLRAVDFLKSAAGRLLNK